MFSATEGVATGPAMCHNVGDGLHECMLLFVVVATMQQRQSFVYENNMLTNISMQARIVCSFGLNGRILLILHSLESSDLWLELKWIFLEELEKNCLNI